jgi:glutamate-1-semialdehyde 2,1-aminomutase
MQKRYVRSEQMLAHALELIPLASQTFSKSYMQYPRGVSPYFALRGKGCRLWDLDGNEYVDFVNGLLAVTLGYCDPEVDAAVRSQLEDGVVFTLAHPLEVEVAEAIVDMVPSAEKVRFGKNASDATAGAVRAARAFTKRDRVAACGYHGWQDWYIGATARNRGVPAATRELTHMFMYNDLESLKSLFARYPGEIAAVIMEPMNVAWPDAGFLEGVRELTREYGALLIFDETITGFRFANGGAQELFGVAPDLSTFGKGLANGFPLSAVAGRADVMTEFEEIFFSFTMGGECLSLAAAKAVLAKLRREPVLETMAARGKRLIEGVATRIKAHGVGDFLSTSGHPTWTFLSFRDANELSMWQIKTLWLQEVLARGILSLGSHNISLAHGDVEVDQLLAVYDEVFPLLREAVYGGHFAQYLRCEPLEPLFRVRS